MSRPDRVVGHWLAHRFRAVCAVVLGPIARRAPKWKWMRYWPLLPTRYVPPPIWESGGHAEVPAQLRTVPGIWRDPEAVERAYREEPLHNHVALHPESYLWIFPKVGGFIKSTPRRVRSGHRVAEVRANQPPAQPQAVDAAVLTAEVQAEAARLGISKIGFAPYDPKYMFAESPPYDQGTVVVCLLEQDWKLTQQVPSAKAEKHVRRVYTELSERVCRLAEFLHEKGYRAQPMTIAGDGIFIHYAVEAGLGQLGLNGQLLTPQAGSRVRLVQMMTNAEMVCDGPVDYGIHPICDACQICVRRCPPGAIPNQRKEHRGITKVKIKTERCMPVMAQAHACAVCMKVCPVQRYGLDRVSAHFVETGEILGKGQDELEGYTWIDGRHYGPGEKPRLPRSLVSPPDFPYDAGRVRPPGSDDPAREIELVI